MNKYRYAALALGSSLAIGGSVFAGTALAGSGGECGQGKAAHGPAARFTELDTNKDAKITLAELTASRASWLARVDTNKDGVASTGELEAGFEAQRKERLEKMFAAQDDNRDGRLARTESHMPSAWFERADQNHDGALTLAELTEARKNMGPGHERERKAGPDGKPGPEGKAGPERKLGHAALDGNGDGKVDRAEVEQAAARQLARLDRNGDGSLTSDEFSRGRGHGRGGHHRAPHPEAAPKPITPAPSAG
jgi:Ca2+-binding EF-hand superfamily protein